MLKSLIGFLSDQYKGDKFIRYYLSTIENRKTFFLVKVGGILNLGGVAALVLSHVVGLVERDEVVGLVGPPGPLAHHEIGE